ncbi:membrane AbrB-like protein [Virgibacillus halotolerans]|uniref:AbrB family transcriptional regulator n=1 Tax=Virgibacillus halotolerans TaxID=1071053 RepID=UPI0019600EEF|nr:AbrB family transcriptional regulator [Virgibacillus halotolerans]MBM7600972.1 membrane AbrB-like protein [Virgibacillus halotolerans]
MEQGAFSKTKQIIIRLISAVIGGALFMLLHIPVPWLLGPMVCMAIGTNIMKRDFVWPRAIRNSGMMIIGYTIGLSMTSSALHEMALQLPSMLLMTLLLLLFCAGVAYIVSKLSDSDYSTSLLASIPGGLTQVITLAEETKGINLAVVTVTQVTRLMIIIIITPLIVMMPIFGPSTAENSTATTIPASASVGLFPNLIIFAVIGIVLALVGAKVNFPTAFLLGPAIGTVILQLFGMEGPQLPSLLINMAQLMIGTHVGLMLKTDQISRKMRTIGLAIGSGIMLVIGGILLSILLTKLQPISRATGLLSLAPGGMDQMGIIAHEIHANLSIVSGYQLFRTFFIYFAVPPLLKLIFKSMNRKKAKQRKQYLSYHEGR